MKANLFELFLYPMILLTLCSKAQPGITFDFENWNTNQSLPGWTLSPFGAEKTDTAFLGNHAIRVWNWYYYSKGYFYNDTDNNFCPFQTVFLFIADKPSHLLLYLYRATTGILQATTMEATTRHG